MPNVGHGYHKQSKIMMGVGEAFRNSEKTSMNGWANKCGGQHFSKVLVKMTRLKSPWQVFNKMNTQHYWWIPQVSKKINSNIVF